MLSPNFGERRDGLRPSLVVLHYTGMISHAAAHRRLCEPEAAVSAHWLISEQGETLQLVDERLRAWHAGAGSWQGESDINSRSIGIEISNTGDQPFSEPQMAALERLLSEVLQRWSISPDRVIAHSDMAPGRKIDPGAKFDWRRLALQGLSIWPDVSQSLSVQVEEFDRMAWAFGYPAEVGADQRLAAFRLRFRPWAEGPVSDDDAQAIAALLRDHPPSRAKA